MINCTLDNHAIIITFAFQCVWDLKEKPLVKYTVHLSVHFA